jgi:hypothetical protein
LKCDNSSKRMADDVCAFDSEVGQQRPAVRHLPLDRWRVSAPAASRVALTVVRNQVVERPLGCGDLARLGRIDPALLRPIVHRPERVQSDLAVVRARHALVSARSSLINHVRGAVKSSGSRLPACDAHMFHKKVPDALPPELLPALRPLLETIGDLTRRIDETDKTIVTLIREHYPEAAFLQQVPGVGPLISLTFVLPSLTRCGSLRAGRWGRTSDWYPNAVIRETTPLNWASLRRATVTSASCSLTVPSTFLGSAARIRTFEGGGFNMLLAAGRARENVPL